MDARTVEQVKDWDSRPFSGGFDALRDLADADFAGAVRAGGSWLFMINGRVIGVFDGELADHVMTRLWYDDDCDNQVDEETGDLDMMLAIDTSRLSALVRAMSR